MSNTPLVSIGLFLYNGERFLEAAIDSILNQTFKDFELIISDNCSTVKSVDDLRPRIRESATTAPTKTWAPAGI
jgi:glycosyltransferase involved in cell wall biosynthesis